MTSIMALLSMPLWQAALLFFSGIALGCSFMWDFMDRMSSPMQRRVAPMLLGLISAAIGALIIIHAHIG